MQILEDWRGGEQSYTARLAAPARGDSFTSLANIGGGWDAI